MTPIDTPTAAASWRAIPSPIGEFLIAGSGTTVVATRLPGQWTTRDVPAAWTHEPGSMQAAASQLDEYFAGERRHFDLRFVPAGTAFQRRVWEALLEIPFGETVSYGKVAAAIGQPSASRAVGMANNRNPIALFIPCHRVVGANGSLTGYGGGLEMKAWLLDHERAVVGG